jgi:hypothetical protein
VATRSHCLLIVHAATTDPATGVRSVGKLTLCDLAGSERINKTGASGDSPFVTLEPPLVCLRTKEP